MTRVMYFDKCNALGGKPGNSITLRGTTTGNIEEPPEVRSFKIMLYDMLILPYLSSNWQKLTENIIFLDNITNKLNYFLLLYPTNELLIMYKDIIAAFETLVLQHMELNALENYLSCGENDASTIVFKTSMIRLRAEYELYNLILGKPNLKGGEVYNQTIIDDILSILNLGELSFNRISEFILTKYRST